MIHTLKPGDEIGIRGPFGRGFPVDSYKGKDVLIAAGGLGLAPARSLIDEILDDRRSFGRLIILYGCKNPGEIIFRDALAEWDEREDVELWVTVDHPDDTWLGHIGVITTLFEHVDVNPYKTVAITVGPARDVPFRDYGALGQRLDSGTNLDELRAPDEMWHREVRPLSGEPPL